MSNTLQELAKWITERERAAFVAGAKWWEFQSTGFTMWQSDQQEATAEAQRRYPDPEAKAETQGDHDWPHTCPSCLEWWVEFDYCAICGREAPVWQAVEKP